MQERNFMNQTEKEMDVTLRDISDLPGSLASRVYESVKEAILKFDLPPGAILRKAMICEQLGVSRSPASEALARLATEGLVDIVPQSGTRVSRFSMAEIEEGAFLREALELAAVAKVARDCTEQQLSQLTRNLRMQKMLLEDKDYAGFYQEDDELHRLIMSFTGYSRVVSVASVAWLQVDRARQLLLPTPGNVRRSYEEHAAIVDAIRDRDPEAAQAAMKKHLSQLVERLKPLEAERPDYFKQ
jgi:DNA-binding GntR family transcriptional regulator